MICAWVGGHGYFGASTEPALPALSSPVFTGGPTVPVLIVNVPDDVPVPLVGFKAVGVQPTGMLLPSSDIVGAVGSPLHSMMELSTFGVTPEADHVMT